MAPFATLMRPGGGSTTSGMPSGEVLRTALLSAVQVDTFPKAVLEVYVTVVEDGGSATAAAIVAASLAIADAGVGMYGLVAACEVVRLRVARGAWRCGGRVAHTAPAACAIATADMCACRVW